MSRPYTKVSQEDWDKIFSEQIKPIKKESNEIKVLVVSDGMEEIIRAIRRAHEEVERATCIPAYLKGVNDVT